mgnify:CR=1 FL=1
MVVMEGQNIDDIVPMVELGKTKPVEVRFIEEMPFNGKGIREVKEVWNYNKIIQTIRLHFKEVENLVSNKSSTSKNFKIKDYKGSFGIIPAFTRTICTDCNRIRITATGMFKNCLFDDGVFNINECISIGAIEEEIKRIEQKMKVQKENTD